MAYSVVGSDGRFRPTTQTLLREEPKPVRGVTVSRRLRPRGGRPRRRRATTQKGRRSTPQTDRHCVALDAATRGRRGVDRGEPQGRRADRPRPRERAVATAGRIKGRSLPITAGSEWYEMPALASASPVLPAVPVELVQACRPGSAFARIACTGGLYLIYILSMFSSRSRS